MKYLLDFKLSEIRPTQAGDAMLVLEPLDKEKGAAALAEARPGQFVNIQVLQSHGTFLRRPISICDADAEQGLLFLYVKDAGAATHCLCNAREGDVFSILLPLGNGFSFDETYSDALLIAGGVGIAPMLLLAKKMNEAGLSPSMLIGAVNKDRLILTEELSSVGNLYISTDDGTSGEKGFVSQHSVLCRDWRHILCCGPLPMMKGIAAIAKERGIDCQVSLENVMACGLGACLCCVEDTADKGNVCVCKEGSVFNINRLKW